jgi:hypothetical protein
MYEKKSSKLYFDYNYINNVIKNARENSKDIKFSDISTKIELILLQQIKKPLHPQRF